MSDIELGRLAKFAELDCLKDLQNYSDENYQWLVTPILKWSLHKQGIKESEITRYGYGRPNSDNVVKDRTSYKVLRVFYKFLERHNLALPKKTIYAKAYNHSHIGKGQDCKLISLNIYKEIRKKYFKVMETKYAKKHIMKQSIFSGKHFIACFDYFFNNVDLYRQELKEYRIALKTLAILLHTPAKADEKVFIPVRILSLGWSRCLSRYNFRLLQKTASYLNAPEIMDLQISQIVNLKCFGYRYDFTIGEYQNQFAVFSRQQLEAMIRLHEVLEEKSIYFVPKTNTSIVKSRKDRKHEVYNAIKLLKNFLKNTNDEFYQRRQCEYKEGMVVKYDL